MLKEQNEYLIWSTCLTGDLITSKLLGVFVACLTLASQSCPRHRSLIQFCFLELELDKS